MDEQVLAALVKWPNVPAVFGWLRLDGRGQWWLREQRLAHPAMVEFFHRNYSRDAAGRYYVQNGPQKVYVSLDVAPFVVRRAANGWSVLPYNQQLVPRTAYMTPEGQLLLEIGGELALLDDRDLVWLVEEALSDWDGELATLPAQLQLPEGGLPLQSAPLAALLADYGIVSQPAP